MAWRDIAASEITAGAPVTQELMAGLVGCDKAIPETVIAWIVPQVQTGKASNPTILTMWMPGCAVNLLAELECWIAAGIPASPMVRLGVTDGSVTVWGAFISIAGVLSSAALNFGTIAIPTTLRGKSVSILFDYDETSGSATAAIQNDPQGSATHGFGIVVTG